MIGPLLDTTSRPTARQVIGSLLAGATHADIAVRNIRLAALNLTESETRGMTKCRVLIGTLDVNSLVFPDLDTDRFRILLGFVSSDRVEIRSAGMGAWLPDFSIYRTIGAARGDEPDTCLIGAHYFHAPAGEPSFTCVLHDPCAITHAQYRFDQLWDCGHDVREAVVAAVAAASRK